MKANPQPRRRSATNIPTATFSAWLMSIVFAGIAVISFAVDQSVITSAPFGDRGTEAHPIGLDQSGVVLSPLRLIETLFGSGSEPSRRAP
jgi:hypothetical protein